MKFPIQTYSKKHWVILGTSKPFFAKGLLYCSCQCHTQIFGTRVHPEEPCPPNRSLCPYFGRL